MTANNQNSEAAEHNARFPLPAAHPLPTPSNLGLSNGNYWFALHYRVQLQYRKAVCGNCGTGTHKKHTRNRLLGPRLTRQSLCPGVLPKESERMSLMSRFFSPWASGRREVRWFLLILFQTKEGKWNTS